MIKLINLRIFGIALLIASIGFVTHDSQNVFSFAGNFITADIDVDEVAMAGNTTNMTKGSTNQTESQNMTGIMDNSSS